jgi:hypothetical protein
MLGEADKAHVRLCVRVRKCVCIYLLVNQHITVRCTWWAAARSRPVVALSCSCGPCQVCHDLCMQMHVRNS